MVRTRARWIPGLCALLGILCLALFVALAGLDWSAPTPAWDVLIAARIQSWSFPGIFPLMLAVSWPGWWPQSWLLVLGICTALYLRGLREALPLAIVAVTSQLIVRGAKESIQRLRPEVGALLLAQDPSFPSGHTTQYTLFLGLLAYLAWKRLRPGWRRGVTIAACFFMIVMVGPSRVFLGHHWPSDVLAGYLLGGGIALICIAIGEAFTVPAWHPR
jgi:membrane-associated phospholipid phosphatase